MSHANQRAFIEACAEIILDRITHPAVVEIGSHDVNGNIRSYFASAVSYIGVDLSAGTGVDVVMSGHEFGESNTYDVVISSEVFEHNPYWLETFCNMTRIATPGGCVIFTCATTGRLEHGTGRTDPSHSPGTSSRGWQYYLNLTERDFTKRLDFDRHYSDYRLFHLRNSNDLYFIGTKREESCNSAQQSWLTPHLSALEKLVSQLARLPPVIENTAHPVLQRMRLLPLRLTATFLPDAVFQTLALVYLKFTSKETYRRPKLTKH